MEFDEPAKDVKRKDSDDDAALRARVSPALAAAAAGGGKRGVGVGYGGVTDAASDGTNKARDSLALNTCQVLDPSGRSVDVRQLYERKPYTVLLFVRHWLWGFCRESAAKMSAAVLARFGRAKDVADVTGDGGNVVPAAPHVQLIAIGQGKPKMAKEFRQTFRFAGDIFVDPTKTLYQRLEFTNLMSAPACSCGCCLRSTWAFAHGCCCKCWCPCDVGDFKQNGGILVVNDHGEMLFRHAERESDDHIDPDVALFHIPLKPPKAGEHVNLAPVSAAVGAAAAGAGAGASAAAAGAAGAGAPEQPAMAR